MKKQTVEVRKETLNEGRTFRITMIGKEPLSEDIIVRAMIHFLNQCVNTNVKHDCGCNDGKKAK